MKRIIFLLLLIAGQHSLSAQSTIDFDSRQTFSHDEIFSSQPVKTFKSVGEADGIIRSILSVVGLKPNFEVRAADISNAAAVVYEGKRYILYDRDFIQSINEASSTSWAGISILAHEIGHHLNGHTLNREGSNPKDELEADEFSGFVLKKLGANLEEAQAAMSMMSEEYGTATHPERNRRLNAIAQGWNNAGDQNLALRSANEDTYEEDYTPQPNNGPQVLASQHILREVHFNSAPEHKFYITTNYKLVEVKNTELVFYGELKKTNNGEFPYVLTDDEQAVIYVANDGYLFDSDGDKIGFMKKYQG